MADERKTVIPAPIPPPRAVEKGPLGPAPPVRKKAPAPVERKTTVPNQPPTMTVVVPRWVVPEATRTTAEIFLEEPAAPAAVIQNDGHENLHDSPHENLHRG